MCLRFFETPNKIVVILFLIILIPYSFKLVYTFICKYNHIFLNIYAFMCVHPMINQRLPFVLVSSGDQPKGLAC